MIKEANIQYCEDIVRIAWNAYQKESEYIVNLKDYPKASLQLRDMEELIKENLLREQPHQKGLVYMEEHLVKGYLLYNLYELSDHSYWCDVPYWGYGAIEEKRERIMSILFQNLAQEIVRSTNVHFQIKVYAHDEMLIRLLSYMQFGIQCEEGIWVTTKVMDVSGNIEFMKEDYSQADTYEEESKPKIYELSIVQKEKRYEELWVLLEQLVNHLKKSPVFMREQSLPKKYIRSFS